MSVPASSPSPSPTPRRIRRLLLVGLASVLLHVLLLKWAGTNFALMNSNDDTRQVVQALLLPQKKPAPPPRPAEPPKPVRKTPPRPRPQPAPAPAPPPVESATPSFGQEPPPAVADGVGIEPLMPMADAAPTDENVPAADVKPAVESAAGGDRYQVDPPPSADLQYAVRALRDGQSWSGYGKIGWHFNGSGYTLRGEAGLKMIFVDVTIFNFTSEGDTDPFGIAPLRYGEKRFRKPETATHFTRDRNQIVFSASQLTYQRHGGEQDRASIIWQLAGIGRGDGARFVSGAEIPVFVAGVRNGETWNIRVVGEEEIELDIGKVRAWHVRRVPRPGTYDQILDIWLAPDHQWYPVRIRYTEVNGEYLDMSVTAIAAAQ